MIVIKQDCNYFLIPYQILICKFATQAKNTESVISTAVI